MNEYMYLKHYIQQPGAPFLFSGVYCTFAEINHILGYKSNLNKVVKAEVIQIVFSDHTQSYRYVNSFSYAFYSM